MDHHLVKYSYTELLRGNFKSLGYFADELLIAKDSYAFFRLIAKSIAPLFKRSPALESFYLNWMKEKQEFKEEYAKTEKAAVKEINKAYDELKSELLQLDLLDHSSVNTTPSSIEKVLDFQEVYAMPAYYEVAYDRIAELLHLLLTLSQESLVKKYAELITIDKSHVDPQTKKVAVIPELHIHLFTFAPSRSKLMELSRVFSWDNYDRSWSIWEHLDLAHWCWHTSLSYFEDKKLEYNDASACADSGFLLNLHAFWIEMNVIKKRSHSPDKVLFFQRDRFTEYLKILLHEVILHQEIHGFSDLLPVTRSPYTLELKLDFGRLLLKVEWFEGDKAEEYLIHKFNDESANYDYTKKLLSAKPNPPVEISSLASGYTIPKYLSRIKLQNTLLSDAFFVQRSTNQMALRAVRVTLSDLPDIDLIKLREQIKQFEPTDKRWFAMQNPQVQEKRR